MIPIQLLTLGQTVRVCYDLTNYAELSISSTGDLTIHKLVGNSPKIIDKRLNDKEIVSAEVNSLGEQLNTPPDRPLKVGDVLVFYGGNGGWFTNGKEYVVKRITDNQFSNAICVTNDSFDYTWFSVNETSMDYWQRYFSLKSV